MSHYYRIPGVNENDSYILSKEPLTEEQIANHKADTEAFERRWAEAEKE